MTIKQLLEMPIGDKTGGFVFEVEHCHKMYDDVSTVTPWKHEVTLTDGKDEIRALVLLDKNRRFNRGNEIRVIVCEIISESSGGYGKMLLVYEHEKITYTPDQLDEPRVIEQQGVTNKWDAINRGKVKHGIFCAVVQKEGLMAAIDQVRLIAISADWVMSPEDEMGCRR